MNSTLGISILYPLLLAYIYMYIYVSSMLYAYDIYIYIYIVCVALRRVKQLNNMKEIIAVYMGWKTW